VATVACAFGAARQAGIRVHLDLHRSAVRRLVVVRRRDEAAAEVDASEASVGRSGGEERRA
jgi:hypothetical protein